QSLIERAIGLDVGVEQVVLRREEGVRPAGRCDQRDAPRALLDDAGAGRAEIEAAPWGRGGGVELVLLGELAQTARAGLLRDHTASVAIHLERQDRIGEAFAVIIEEQQRVQKSMAELVMQRLVGVGDVEPALDHAAGNELPGLAMTLVFEGLLSRLAPDI